MSGFLDKISASKIGVAKNMGGVLRKWTQRDNSSRASGKRKFKYSSWLVWCDVINRVRSIIALTACIDNCLQFLCNDCDNEYIGQTKRQFGTRLKEHQEAVFFFKKENPGLSEYTCLLTTQLNGISLKLSPLIGVTTSAIDWHINSAHAPLNRDDGSLLPDAN